MKAFPCGMSVLGFWLLLHIGQTVAQSPAETSPAPEAPVAAPQPAPAPPPPPGRQPLAKARNLDTQIEVDGQFFEVPEAIAMKLGLLSTLERPPGPKAGPGNPNANKAVPAGTELNSVMEPAEAAELLRKLRQARGVHLLSTARVTTRSGQRAVLEVIREFRYPTEFQFDKDRSCYIPSAFETRNLGVTLEVNAVAAQGAIDLDLVPQVVELEGYVRADDGQPVPLANGRRVGANMALKDLAVIKWPRDTVLQPIFSTRKVNASVTLSSGQSMVIGGLKREDHTDARTAAPDSPMLYVLVTARSAARPRKSDVLPVAFINPADPAGYVRSPFAPEAKPVDAHDLPSGTELKCPVTGNFFRLP